MVGNSLLQQTLKLDSQRWEIVGDGLPDDAQVHTEVLMNEHVSDSRDIGPGDVRREAFVTGQQVTGRFTNHLEIAHHGVNRLLVSAKLVEAQSGDVALDVGDRTQDVLDAKPPSSR